MMYFFHVHTVLIVPFHERRQCFVELEKQINANAEIGGIKESSVFFYSIGINGFLLVKPSRSARQYRDAIIQAQLNIRDCSFWLTELYGHISLFYLLNGQLVPVFYGNSACDSMSSFKGDFLYSPSHLSIA